MRKNYVSRETYDKNRYPPAKKRRNSVFHVKHWFKTAEIVKRSKTSGFSVETNAKYIKMGVSRETIRSEA